MAHFLRPTALKLRDFKGIAELDLTLDDPNQSPATTCRPDRPNSAAGA